MVYSVLTVAIVFAVHQFVLSVELQDPNPFFAEERKKLPCSYFNTVNITDGVFGGLGQTITHNDVIYQEDQYKEYDYIINEKYEKVKVTPHIRGCVCQYRACLRLCCEPGQYYDEKGVCLPMDVENSSELLVQVHDSKLATTKINRNLVKDQKISYVVGIPCNVSFFYDNSPGDEFTLYVNGSVSFLDQSYDQSEYCLAYAHSYTYNATVLSLNLCIVQEDTDYHHTATISAMIFSIPFLFMTFFVYAWLRELRVSVHGKSLMCYVFFLAIGYTILSIVKLNGSDKINKRLCSVYGYIIQGSFMVSFLWLNVISFDLWWTFSRGKNHSSRKFLKYSSYVFGLAISMLLFTLLMDSIESISPNWRPNIGIMNCWLQKTVNVQFLFLYLPLFIIISANAIFFALTARHIRMAQNASVAALTKGDSQRHTKSQSDTENFSLFFRLFIIMGVTWSLEFISWVIEINYEDVKFFFIITDLCNCIQGILIFIMFVCKARVKKLIMRRYFQMRGIPEETTATEQSGITMKSRTTN